MIGRSGKRHLLIFRMQEPVSKNFLSKKEEVGQYQEVVQEKDVLIRNNKAKIKELEAEIAELKLDNQKLEVKLKANDLDDNGFQQIMLSYDDFFKKVWNEREDLLRKNSVMDKYLENLECSYHDIVEKFQKAREVIYQMKSNQDMLMNELDGYKESITILENKYESLKLYSESTIADANVQLGKQQKETKEEMTKLKTKILQRQAKINELEKQIRTDDSKPLFAPLRNRLANK